MTALFRIYGGPGALEFFNGHAALLDPQNFATFLAPLRDSEWVVYSKRPFGGPEEILRYPGAHRGGRAIEAEHATPSHSQPP